MLWLFPLLGLCFLAVRLRGAPTTLVVVEFYPLYLRVVCPVRMVVLVVVPVLPLLLLRCCMF